MDNGLNFDPWQFANSKAMPVSAETGISFNDYRTMHTQQIGEKPAAFIPPFALHNSQLQQVILGRAWKYAYGGRAFSSTFDREQLNKAATERALRGNKIGRNAPVIQKEGHERHKAAIRKAGGFMQLHAAIAFRSWRLGMSSVDVATTVGTTPVAVRQALWRMRDTAKQLGFEVGRAGHTAGTKRGKKPKPEPETFSAERAVVLYTKSGLPVPRIALRFGFPRGHGNNKVRRALIDAGVYTKKSRATIGTAPLQTSVIS